MQFKGISHNVRYGLGLGLSLSLSVNIFSYISVHIFAIFAILNKTNIELFVTLVTTECQ